MPQPSAPTQTPRVLIVDDSPSLTHSFAHLLKLQGIDAVVTHSGREAIEALETGLFDVVLTDVAMPGMSGLELLREVRKRDLDVPVVLITGQPSVDTAVQAVADGAHRYLTKPVAPAILLETVRRAVQVCRIARELREAGDELGETGKLPADAAGRHAVLDTALASLWLAYQPIVTTQGVLFGYEAMVRTDSRLFSHPGELVELSDQIGRIDEVCFTVLGHVTLGMSRAPQNCSLLVNTHPKHLETLLRKTPEQVLAQAPRIVLEITERASLAGVPGVADIIKELRSLGFRIAIDDLGSGYAGLTSFVTLEPDLVKLDVSLVRNINESRTRQKLVRSITTLGKDMGFLVVAEGVESELEEASLIAVGCDLLQGTRYARPDREFTPPSWFPSDASMAPLSFR